MHIDLVGPFPPPYGGISVHLERLADRLEGAGHSVRRVAAPLTGEKIWTSYRRILRESRGDLIHFHVIGAYDKIAIALVERLGRRVVLTVHGQGGLENQLDEHRGAFGWLVRASLRRLDALVAVSDRIRSVAIERAGLDPARVFEVPAFLPPDRDALLAASPGAEDETFFRAHRPVISANAFSLRDYGPVQLYGADLLPELVARVRARHPEAGALLYLSVCEPDDAPRLAALEERARALGVGEHLRIVTGSRPFGPALVRSDLLVRPTATDGDAVSLREALWVGVPVVASDCVARPEGTIAVPVRDPDALAGAVLGALADPAGLRAKVAALPRRDPFADLLAVYASVLRR